MGLLCTPPLSSPEQWSLCNIFAIVLLPNSQKVREESGEMFKDLFLEENLLVPALGGGERAKGILIKYSRLFQVELFFFFFLCKNLNACKSSSVWDQQTQRVQKYYGTI